MADGAVYIVGNPDLSRARPFVWGDDTKTREATKKELLISASDETADDIYDMS